MSTIVNYYRHVLTLNTDKDIQGMPVSLFTTVFSHNEQYDEQYPIEAIRVLIDKWLECHYGYAEIRQKLDSIEIDNKDIMVKELANLGLTIKAVNNE